MLQNAYPKAYEKASNDVSKRTSPLLVKRKESIIKK